MTSSFLCYISVKKQHKLDNIDEEFKASTILESVVISIEFFSIIKFSLSLIDSESLFWIYFDQKYCLLIKCYLTLQILAIHCLFKVISL